MLSPEDSTIRTALVPGKRVATVIRLGGCTHDNTIFCPEGKSHCGLCRFRLCRSATRDLLASGRLDPGGNGHSATTPRGAAGLGAQLRSRFPQGLIAIALEQSRGPVIAALMH